MMRVSFIAILVCTAAIPLLAQSNDVGAWFETATIRKTTDPQGVITFDHGRGWGISGNHFWTRSISTELAYATARSDGRVDFTEGTTLDLGRLRLQSTSLVAKWHLGRHSAIDPYIGAGVARVTASALTSADLGAAGVSAVHIDSRVTWCGNAGVNFNVKRQLAVAVDARYLRYTPDSSAPGDEQPTRLRLNPLLLSAGVRFRF